MNKLADLVTLANGDRNAPELQFVLTIDEADDFYRHRRRVEQPDPARAGA